MVSIPTDDSRAHRVRSSRASIGRLVLRLTVAGLALVGFILVLGDLRRKSVPLAQANGYARQLTGKYGPAQVLPLHLEFTVPKGIETKPYTFEHLSEREARQLRQESGEVIVAYTRAIGRVLMPDGRAAVFFRPGAFDVRWMGLEAFDQALAQQQERARRTKQPDATNGPSEG